MFTPLRFGLVLLLAACANRRLDALELRIAALEAPATGTAPPTVTSEDQTAAAELMRAAQEAANSGDVARAQAALAELRATYPTSRAAIGAYKLESELAVIGQPAPATTVSQWYTPATGDLRAPGTTVVVFFETWCPHCQREMPNMATLARAMPEVHFLALTKLTRSTTDADVQSMIDAGQWPFPVGREAGDLSAAFAVTGIPSAAVVRDGKIVWRGHPARLTADMLAALAH